MKKQLKIASLSLIAAFLMVPTLAHAATSPVLGAADSFTVLSGTYSNTSPGSTINGDLGYTTPPVFPPTVNGSTHVADATYNQAGIDQGTALSALNSQPCTFTFAPGAVDLASDTTHGAAGSYAPGVYCISGAASIGGGATLTLTGAGTYIFRMTGALTSTANSIVTVAGGGSACNVFWTPGAATTLGANSTFGGTIIDASGVTIGNTVLWTGRALAFGGTVSTDNDTLSSSACSAKTNQAVSAAKTPGLPNTGESQPRHAAFSQGLILFGVFTSCLVLARIVFKRA